MARENSGISKRGRYEVHEHVGHVRQKKGLWKTAFYAFSIIVLILATLPDTAGLREISLPNDKLNHFSAFLALTFLMNQAFQGRQDLWKITWLGFYGILIEIIQAFLPYREFSTLDFAADMVGVSLFLVLRTIFRKYVSAGRGVD
jgi:VanZ family protein